MEIQLDDNIKRARFPLLAWLTSRQAFWVSVAVILACIFLSFATNSFATSNNLLQRHPQLHLRRDHCARDDDRDHHRRHRSVGRFGAVPVQHDPRGRDACRLQHRGRHRRLARNGAADRRDQRRADRLSGYPAVCGHARHAVDRAQPRDGRLQQHRGVPVRSGSRQAACFSVAAPCCSGSPTP